MVHQINQDKGVPRVKAAEVVSKLFDTKIKDEGGIKALEPISWRDFLVLFFSAKEKKLSKTLTPDEIYLKAWRGARNMNYLPAGELTYTALQEFLYRYKVSEFFGWPYYEGLVFSENEIEIRQFPDPYAVPKILEKLTAHLIFLRASAGTEDKVRAKKLEIYRERFKELEVKIADAHHPFHVLPDMPVVIREKVAALDLKEVLGGIHYDYSHNDKNRQHNLIAGLSKMDGRVMQPGETLDFLKTLSDKNWWDYKYGWLIINGKNAWSFGGGLCGAATMVFTAAWRAGFEVVERHPHSIYYKSLYPEESFGADAALFRNSKNMKIRNGTANPILFYVKNDTETKKLSLYLIGNPAYKRIETEGPVETGKRTYEWTRRMEAFDGTIKTDTLNTRYYGVEK
ncbi:VanW family protein [Candidatus Peregrinibacteria bacterium]|nr:VanW family protein [Candidatus Peregrinibacteria bacterium]